MLFLHYFLQFLKGKRSLSSFLSLLKIAWLWGNEISPLPSAWRVNSSNTASYPHTLSDAQESHFSCRYSREAWCPAGSNNNKLLGDERVNGVGNKGLLELAVSSTHLASCVKCSLVLCCQFVKRESLFCLGVIKLVLIIKWNLFVLTDGTSLQLRVLC